MIWGSLWKMQMSCPRLSKGSFGVQQAYIKETLSQDAVCVVRVILGVYILF